MKPSAAPKPSLPLRMLSAIERAGNALPQPALLFLLLTFVVVFGSWLAFLSDFQAVHPVKKQTIGVVNLLSVSGLHLLLTDMVKNFTGFAPLGTVLIAMLGFSLAEKSGLLSSLIKLLVLKAPRRVIVPAVLLAGVLSHTAGDVGYLLLIPLSAMAFHTLGMHPIAGIATSFAGVSGGFAANFLLSTADPLLAGLSQEAARILDPKYVVTPVVNWYFMSASSLLIIGAGTVITHRITIPYLGAYHGEVERTPLTQLTSLEKRGLTSAGLMLLALTVFIAAGLLPEHGYLREPGTDSVLHSPFIKGIVAVIFFVGALTGLAYGLTAKTLKSQSDVVEAMADAMKTMAPYLVLVFFAAQFIALFNASHLGMILAIHGSEILKGLGLGPVPLMIGFILLTCALDLVIGSASAKWALMAPIFVPMFMLLGYSPELTQASYRIADSVVNIISPLMSYFPLILAFTTKYDPKAQVGTLIAVMLPYTLTFLLFWSLMLILWMTLELPLGPGASLWYKLAAPAGP